MKSIKYFSIIFIAFSALFCRGAEVGQRPSRPTVVDWSDKVVKQEGATCGFHAVKNAVYLYRYLVGELNEEAAFRYLKASGNSTVFSIATWKTCVEAQDNLDEAQINTLLSTVPIGINRGAITVIPNVHTFEPNRLMLNQTEQLANFLHDLRAGNPCVHAFVLGNMHEVSQSYGHWVAVVVHADESGTVTFHYADSWEGNQVGRDLFIESLQEKVLSIEADQLRIETCMQGCLHAVETLVSREWHDKHADYQNALRLLREAYQRIVTNHLEQSPIFITEYLPGIKQLARTLYELSGIDTAQFIATLTSLEGGLSQSREQERKLAQDALLQEQTAKEIEECFNNDVAHFMGTVQTGNQQQIEQEYAVLLSVWGDATDRIAALEAARNGQ